MSQKIVKHTIVAMAFVAGAMMGNGGYAAEVKSTPAYTPAYDEKSYTQYVQDTMRKLDKLYLEFCGECGASAENAEKARREYLKTARELMSHMNAKFDRLDPRKGDALSATEVLVNIHALTMLVDVLTASYMESVAEHPYTH
ncbi:MAG: hypothetical protein WBX11_09900 [Thiobacillaceae bacterium]